MVTLKRLFLCLVLFSSAAFAMSPESCNMVLRAYRDAVAEGNFEAEIFWLELYFDNCG